MSKREHWYSVFLSPARGDYVAQCSCGWESGGWPTENAAETAGRWHTRGQPTPPVQARHVFEGIMQD